MRLLGWATHRKLLPSDERWAASSFVSNSRKNLTDFAPTDGEMTPLLRADLPMSGLEHSRLAGPVTH
jgi:hypothetical protein